MLQVKVRTFTDRELQSHLQTVKETQIKKLKLMKERGASKQRCYDNFPKTFVDTHY